MKVRSERISILVLLAGTLFSTGCGSSNTADSAIARSNSSNIQRLANMYQAYQFRNRYKGPESEEQLREFIAGLSQEKLSKRGIDPENLDLLFVSERDDQPFEIRWGVPSGPHGSTEAVIFEKTGVGGMRMVGFLNMVQREVEDAEYNQLLSEKPPTTKQTRQVKRET